MADITLLAPELRDREVLQGMLGEMGHETVGAGRLEEAVEFLRERKGRALLVVDGAGLDAAVVVREAVRAFPFLPIVVALKTRDARRAVELMRVGAAEVAAPPWTREDLKACVSKGLRVRGTAVAPDRPVPRRSGVYFALAVGVFFAAAIGTSSWRRAEQQRQAAAKKVDRWDLPVSHPAGLAFDGRDLWVVDWFSQSLYQHTLPGLSLRAVRHLPAETPLVAAFAGDALWTVSADGTVVKRLRDAKMTPVESYRRAAPNPAGLASDGLYLWTLDSRAKILRKHLPDGRLTVVGTFRWPGLKPAGLLYDGKTLWSLDAGDRRLLQHNLERPDQVVGSLALPEYGMGDYLPVGVTFDGERFWTVGQRKDGKGPARLARHSMESQ